MNLNSSHSCGAPQPEEKCRAVTVESTVALTDRKTDISEGEEHVDSTGILQASEAAVNQIDRVLAVNWISTEQR